MPTRRGAELVAKGKEETAGWLGKARGGVGKRAAEEQPKLNDPLQARALTELVGSFSGHRIVHREKGRLRSLLSRECRRVLCRKEATAGLRTSWNEGSPSRRSSLRLAVVRGKASSSSSGPKVPVGEGG